MSLSSSLGPALSLAFMLWISIDKSSLCRVKVSFSPRRRRSSSFSCPFSATSCCSRSGAPPGSWGIYNIILYYSRKIFWGPQRTPEWNVSNQLAIQHPSPCGKLRKIKSQKKKWMYCTRVTVAFRALRMFLRSPLPPPSFSPPVSFPSPVLSLCQVFQGRPWSSWRPFPVTRWKQQLWQPSAVVAPATENGFAGWLPNPIQWEPKPKKCTSETRFLRWFRYLSKTLWFVRSFYGFHYGVSNP